MHYVQYVSGKSDISVLMDIFCGAIERRNVECKCQWSHSVLDTHTFLTPTNESDPTLLYSWQLTSHDTHLRCKK